MRANDPALRPQPQSWLRTILGGKRPDGAPVTMSDFQELRWWLHDISIRARQHDDPEMCDVVTLAMIAVEHAQRAQFPIPY